MWGAAGMNWHGALACWAEGWVLVAGQSAAFMSYVRFNDVHDDGQITQFRERLSAEVRAQTGEEFLIFQDRSDIAWGQAWRQRIEQALDAATLLIVIITPSFFRSSACRAEVDRFVARERELGRQDLIMPVYYVGTPELDDLVLRNAGDLTRLVASRQFADWRELRFEPFTSPVVRRALAQLASRIRDALWRQPREASVPATPERPAALQKSAHSAYLVEPVERPVIDAVLLRDLVQAAGEPDASVSPLLQRLVRREIKRVTSFVRQVPVGNEIAYDGEDREWLLGLTQEAQRSIDALSLVIVTAGMHSFDGGLWTTDLGNRYMTLQREAIDRQVSIRRIFVFEDQDVARDEVFFKIIQTQRGVGVDVRMLDRRLVPDWLQSRIFDYVIFDGAVSYEISAIGIKSVGSMSAIARTLLVPIPARVRELENQFRQLWAAADPERQVGE
jgi:hypothetical protein